MLPKKNKSESTKGIKKQEKTKSSNPITINRSIINQINNNNINDNTKNNINNFNNNNNNNNINDNTKNNIFNNKTSQELNMQNNHPSILTKAEQTFQFLRQLSCYEITLLRILDQAIAENATAIVMFEMLKNIMNPTLDYQLSEYSKFIQQQVDTQNLFNITVASIDILLAKINIEIKIAKINENNYPTTIIYLLKLAQLKNLHTAVETASYSEDLKSGHKFLIFSSIASLHLQLSKDPFTEEFQIKAGYANLSQSHHRETAIQFAEKSESILKEQKFHLSKESLMLGYSILIPLFMSLNDETKTKDLLINLMIMRSKFQGLKLYPTLLNIISKFPENSLFPINISLNSHSPNSVTSSCDVSTPIYPGNSIIQQNQTILSDNRSFISEKRSLDLGFFNYNQNVDHGKLSPNQFQTNFLSNPINLLVKQNKNHNNEFSKYSTNHGNDNQPDSQNKILTPLSQSQSISSQTSSKYSAYISPTSPSSQQKFNPSIQIEGNKTNIQNKKVSNNHFNLPAQKSYINIKEINSKFKQESNRSNELNEMNFNIFSENNKLKITNSPKNNSSNPNILNNRNKDFGIQNENSNKIQEIGKNNLFNISLYDSSKNQHLLSDNDSVELENDRNSFISDDFFLDTDFNL